MVNAVLKNMTRENLNINAIQNFKFYIGKTLEIYIKRILHSFLIEFKGQIKKSIIFTKE